MVKLIIGVKGSGKTKTLISMVNEAAETSKGNVVCIEKGIKLRYDVTHKARLINVDEYYVFGSRKLFGFIAGILASDHDVSDIFVDAALRICDNNVDNFEAFVNNVDELSEKYHVNVVMTSSLAVEDATDGLKKFI